MRGRLGVGAFVVWGVVVGAGIARSAVALAGPAPGAKPAASPALPAPALRALDKPAFTATPDELLALGKAAPTGDWSTVMLRYQRDVSYDDQGRATVRTRQVWVVQGGNDGSDGGDDEDAITAVWHPSHQDRPVIRARAIAPGGAVVELDPSQVTDAPTGPKAAPAGDTRYVEARFPPAQHDGAVVEQEIVVHDREPPPAGSVDTVSISDPFPTSSTVLTYAAPVALRLHHVERQLPAGARVRHQVTGNRETWSYELGALPARTAVERDLPDDVIAWPYVGVSTGASWEAVARAYRTLLDQRIAAGPVELPAELPHAASAEAVDAITAWVHQHAHRSGEGLAEPVRLPRPPAETVQQAAGDGNDKATLLVALLRQAGIRADVALLATWWDHRVDPDLPGVGAFDHAIVRARVGTRELWIDPGEELARPGQLPDGDQGRRTLVIADDTRGLATTPLAAAADNAIRDVRTFVAAEQGWSKLTRVVRTTGAFEIERRRQVHTVRPDAIKRMFGAASERLFGGTLDQVTSSGAQDLSRPFEMTFEIKDAHRVATEPEDIDVYLYPHATLEELPWQVRSKSDAPRTHDFVWRRPQVHEVENRIVVPPGFALPVPAADQVRPLGGAATFTTHQEIDGQTLIVRFRLDTGKPRLTPAELAAMQAAVHELDQETVHIKIHEAAFALLDAGKPRDAIAEGQRLIALHPAEALHHTQLAVVLMRAGAGEAARREARKAVAMAPTDAAAFAGLGWILSLDTVGRPFTYDWDRAGAIAALRQARKLDPRHLGATLTLAQVLEHDPAGRLFDGPDLAAAAEAWRAALELDRTDERAMALVRVLVWSEQFAEAEKVARGVTASPDRDRWIVMAAAGQGGAAHAIQVAGELRGGTDGNALVSFAGWAMMMLQRYDAARELLSSSGVLPRGTTGTAATIAALQRRPPLQLRPAEPRSAISEVVLVQLDPRRTSPVFWDAQVEHELRAGAAQVVTGPLRDGLSGRWIGDVVQAMKIDVEGDAGAWRATIDGDGKPVSFYLALDRGAVKLIGAGTSVTGIGRYVLRGRDARADAQARKLLDWLRADADRTNLPGLAGFKQLWGPGIPASHDAIQLAAAVLAAETDPDRVLLVATRCASTLPDAELACHEARFLSYRMRHEWPEAVAESESILALRPRWSDGWAQYHAWVLARAGRFDDADRTLDAALARDPQQRGARRGRFEVAMMRLAAGAPIAATDVIARGDDVTNDPASGPGEFNNIAWARLGAAGMPGPIGDLTGPLELARKAVDKAPQIGGYLNTLAALEAAHGDLDRAIQDNKKAMELRGVVVPTDDDWLVIGWIDEQLGLTGDATAAYKRVARPTHDPLVSSYQLAQARLAALGARQ